MADEPFTRLLTQGMVCKETYYRESTAGKKTYYNPEQVDVETDDKGRAISARLIADGQPVVIGPVEKMSKSKNNGVDPQTLIDRYGADTVRLYTMFAAPPEQSLEWSDSSVEGAYRFLRGLWRLTYEHVSRGPAPQVPVVTPALKALRRKIHETIVKVTDDVSRRYKFNTAIAAVMELVNALGKADAAEAEARAVLQEGLEVCVLLLAPIVPHCTEAMWAALGHHTALALAAWPVADQRALAREELEVVVQVNGKKRANILLPVDASDALAQERAMADEQVARFIDGHTVRKVIVVPGRLVNIVVG